MFLHLLSRAAEPALPGDGRRSTDEGMILGAVAGPYRERLVQRLGEELFGALKATLRAVAPSVEFRAADPARAAGVWRARAPQVVDRPLERRVVRRGRTEQASKYLVPGGETLVAPDAVLRGGTDGTA